MYVWYLHDIAEHMIIFSLIVSTWPPHSLTTQLIEAHPVASNNRSSSSNGLRVHAASKALGATVPTAPSMVGVPPSLQQLLSQ
mmetsp:Transcript_2195/g.3652  ORF Transcript_2195/g.3652 Transcript_2195/m.3652 type:complete len:83 (-) Transcript_2195:774-1022(-)